MSKKTDNELRATADEVVEKLSDIMEIAAVYTSKREIIVKGIPPAGQLGIREAVESRIGHLGRIHDVSFYDSSAVVRLAINELNESGKIPWVNIGLILLTLAATIVAGAFWTTGLELENPWSLFADPERLIRLGLPFSISLMAILLFHEFGHYVAARIHGVNVSLPYFIPAPIFSPFGTFGALIISKSPFLNRRQLLDVGASGPLSGLVVAIVVLFIGIGQSSIMPMPDEGGLIIGDSLLLKGMAYMLKGPVPEGSGLFLSSIAIAGWVGLFVTMLNLLPMGQLDGGRIAYALFGRWQKVISRIVLLALVVMSFYWVGWALWIIIGLLMKPTHQPTIMDEIPIGRTRQVVGIISIIAFIVCFIPIPVTGM